jgi:lambda family phage portal protein
MKWPKFLSRTKPVKKQRKNPKLVVMNDNSFGKDLEKRLIGINPTRLTGDFEENTVRGSISNAIRASAESQRDYARTLQLNSPHIKKAVQYQIDNVVGADGINPQPRVTDANGEINKVVNKNILDKFKYWSENRKQFSRGNKHNWRSFSLLVESARFVDGEVFIRMHESTDGFKVEIIGADRVPYGETLKSETTYTRNGIEYDNETDEPVSYSFKVIDKLTDTQNGKLEIVPADEVIHYYLEKIPGQQRGISELTAVMATTVQYDEFIKAAIVQKRQAASSMGFITQDKETQADVDLGLGHDHSDGDIDHEVDVIQEIEAGTLQKLPAGSDIKQFTATQGADDAASFSDLLDGNLSMGLNFYKQGYKGDTAGVNYSSARFGAMNERGNFKNIQSTLQEVVLMPLFEKWLTYMIMTEQFDFKMTAVQSIMASITWTFPRRESIDPLKDTDNDIRLVENGFKSASQVILERGDDPEKVFAEVESEKGRFVPKQVNKVEVAEAPALVAAETQDITQE